VNPAAEIRALLLLIVYAVVDYPSAVSVEIAESGTIVEFRLRVAELDIGKVIGNQGRTARSIRTLLLGAGTKSGIHCRLDILMNSQ
jgi:predicted RNA-binding protein YlqC (UPF0109 family)